MKTLFKILNSKTLFGTLCLVSIAIQTSCNTDESCHYSETVEDCIPFEPNSEYAGFTVTTAYQDPETTSGWVGGIYDTRFNSQAPKGDDWGTTTTTTPVGIQRPANWKESEIGQVFGIAIDKDENIFLASSDIYIQGSSPFPSNSGQQSQIFKCSPSSYAAVPFLTFTTGTDALNDLGNIAYDKVNDQLFVTNLEDGKIYRVTNLSGTTGAIAEAYDPWVPDISPVGTIVNPDEQVWGIGVNYEAGAVKVYFPRISNTERSIYSITLSDGKFPPATSEILEITAIPGTQQIISDIAFNSTFNQMLIAEHGYPHNALAMSFTKSGTWGFNKTYFVGGAVSTSSDGTNAAGGVDFAYQELDENINANCDQFFWASGNYMDAKSVFPNKVYGIQGIAYAGNNSTLAPSPTGNQETDIFIDNDGNITMYEKYAQGDVEVFDASECFDLCDFQ